MQRSMIGSALEHQHLLLEAEQERATALQLNARVSELAIAEQVRL